MSLLRWLQTENPFERKQLLMGLASYQGERFLIGIRGPLIDWGGIRQGDYGGYGRKRFWLGVLGR